MEEASEGARERAERGRERAGERARAEGEVDHQTVYMSREGNSLLKGSWTTGEVDTKRVQKNQVDSIGVEIEC